ncbi:thiolase C-terminal domain-containing protein [Kallotenue papyrolyticum]|uniref:thiolase C-terminal domain-containing protein n=1 Tax=Kallotenue papyrolyticum TaxID=1325125 RepID=UPI0004785FB5|nr:acetyl-CoA acetyltransferase [Kallotenue papyrolyticum]
MRDTYIVGIGQTPVGEHWEAGLLTLATRALAAARAEADLPITALFVANAFGGELAGQSLLGAAIADAAGLGPIEALRVEAGGASGGVALRQAWLAVASGACEVAAVVGVEKVTDLLDAEVEAALAQTLDAEYEAALGLTQSAGWALLQRRYMHVYGYDEAAFTAFAVNAHANAATNPQAQYRMAISAEQVLASPPVAAPIRLLDSATPADGAAALILASAAIARELPGPRVRLAGSAVAVGPHALHARADLLWLEAVARSTEQALRLAGVAREAIDVAELSDQHAIVATLALESAGLAARGTAPALAADGLIRRDGALPLATFGGCKARGDAVGALGVYQVVELTQQLRGTAGANQVADARVALAQCLGGLGATAATQVLIREE